MSQIENLLSSKVGMSSVGEKLTSLWNEYEMQNTLESQFVKDLDKFDMILQADEYEQRYNVTLDSFFKSTEGVFQTAQVQRWDKYLRSQRASRLSKSDTDEESSSKK